MTQVAPIAAVTVADGDTAGDSNVETVPTHPQATRTAAQPAARASPIAAARVPVQLFAELLRAELAPTFATLRAAAALHAARVGPDTAALLRATMKAHSDRLAATVHHLERFQTRPRVAEMSPRFATTLCRQLEQGDASTTARCILCVCTIDTSLPHPPGPVTLAPLLAGLLRAHVLRRADVPVASGRASKRGLCISYSRRDAVSSTSWHLLLASLALQPWGWRVFMTSSPREDRVNLCPVSTVAETMSDP